MYVGPIHPKFECVLISATETVAMPECQQSHSGCSKPATDSYCGRRQGHPDATHTCKSCGSDF